MGADFFVSLLMGDARRRLNFRAGESAIEDLRHRPLKDWPAELLDYAGFDLERDNAEAEVDELLRQLHADLELLKDVVEDGRPDAWGGTMGRRRLVLSGGDSLGGAPTEAYEAISRLCFSGVAKAVGFAWCQ